MGWTASVDAPFDQTRKGKMPFGAGRQTTLALKTVKTYPLDGDDAFTNAVLKDNYIYLTQSYNLYRTKLMLPSKP